MRFEFIAKHRGIWPVTWMCEVLDVSPSGFYSWRSRPPSNRTTYDETLIRDIRRSFKDSDRTYGVRRIWPDLLDWGHEVGRERVARLVRALGLVAQPKRRKRPVDTGTRLESSIAPNTLDRAFTATALSVIALMEPPVIGIMAPLFVAEKPISDLLIMGCFGSFFSFRFSDHRGWVSVPDSSHLRA